ncbi:CAP domain-containing protein [Pannus brasiliensis CCIBt3594]|uniref:CAP domain-containing protein n=1 Tax=Pannus brasiliensis CCIBt3594 TaxID=1427578 RepID=A0AAW9R1F4_9CHRO
MAVIFKNTVYSGRVGDYLPLTASDAMEDDMAIADRDKFDTRVLDLVNQQRQQRGLSRLTLSQELDTAADRYASDMANQDFFSHTGKDGSTMRSRVEKAGYTGWTTLGENIAAGQTTPEAVVNAWMNSSGHRANILNSKFTHMGLGYAYLANDTGQVNYKHYWVQDFGAGDPTPGTYVAESGTTTTPTTFTAARGVKGISLDRSADGTILTAEDPLTGLSGEGRFSLTGGQTGDELAGMAKSGLDRLLKNPLSFSGDRGNISGKVGDFLAENRAAIEDILSGSGSIGSLPNKLSGLSSFIQEHPIASIGSGDPSNRVTANDSSSF